MAAAPPRPKQGSVVKYKGELRKAIRRNARQPEINFLNIVAMLDLMTILLVFMLKGVASSTAAIPQSKDMTLPKSISSHEPAQEGIQVVVSKTMILVGDRADPVVTLPSRDSLAQSGVDAKDKRDGPNGLYITPLGQALQDARKLDKMIRQTKGLDPNYSEAIVIADATTPYRLLMEVLFTLGETEFGGKFHLMVLSAGPAK